MTDGWRTVKLGEIAEVIISGVDKKSKPSEVPVRLCNYVDVYHSHRINSSSSFMEATATPAEIRRCRLETGDVVITKDSETPNDIAVPAFVEAASSDLVCGYHLAIIRSHPTVSGRFLKYLFDSPQAKRYFASRANGATRYGLTKRSITDFRCKIPDLSRQRQIADILGEWDDAISKLKVVHDATERRNAGIRCSIFDAPQTRNWPKVRLASIATIKKGLQLNRTEMGGGAYPVWNGGIVPSGYTDAWTTDKNTITISEGGSCGFVNLCRQRFWAGGHCFVLHDLSADADLDFVYHALKRKEYQIARLRVGTALPNIQLKAMARVAIRLPDLATQQNIGSFLSLAWNETDAFGRMIESRRRQRRGLVQSLLAENAYR